jgi:hypothetical protein
MSLHAELSNDLVVIGEDAARAFTRGTKKLKEHIEPMAHGLAEAKRRYPNNREFSSWLKSGAYSEISHQDRAALIKMGQNWSEEVAALIEQSLTASPRLIWDTYQKGNNENEDEDEDGVDDADNDSGSEFYGSERVTRTNEAWDTIDPRLVTSLVEAIPSLKDRMVWEPSAGCGLMLDQLEASGVKVYAATDIEPRRLDITQLDLLTATEMIPSTDAIITNPPWGRLAAPFVRKALELAHMRKALVAMLLPLPWITGRKIADMTGSPAFEALVVPRYRARWMTEAEEAELSDGPQAPKMNHVWLVWDFARDPAFLPVMRFVDAPVDEPVAEDEMEEAIA